MGKTKAERNLAARAEPFQALGRSARRVILNVVQMGPRRAAESATILLSSGNGLISPFPFAPGSTHEILKGSPVMTFRLAGATMRWPQSTVFLTQPEPAEVIEEDA
jgi:hypothetical protein